LPQRAAVGSPEEGKQTCLQGRREEKTGFDLGHVGVTAGQLSGGIRRDADVMGKGRKHENCRKKRSNGHTNVKKRGAMGGGERRAVQKAFIGGAENARAEEISRGEKLGGKRQKASTPGTETQGQEGGFSQRILEKHRTMIGLLASQNVRDGG